MTKYRYELNKVRVDLGTSRLVTRSGGGSGWGGQGGCERRIEVFVKIKKNRGGGVQVWLVCVGGGGAQGGCERNVGGRGDVKIQKKKFFLGGSGRGVRVDVNKELKFL